MRIGCDLVLISRIANLSQKESFLAKVFHPIEIEYCSQRGAGRDASLAARFAAKEAFGKALGTGIFSQGVNPSQIWVENSSSGKPELQFSQDIRTMMEQCGYSRCEVSLSHQGEYALATVLFF